MSAPDVSIIIPIYNGDRTITTLLESLLAQRYERARFEIIVVDNRSTDATASQVGRFPVRLLHERDIQSSYAARNRGVRAAQGAILAFTDADCIAHPGWLDALCRPFAQPHVGASAGAIIAAPPTTLVQQFCAYQRWYELAVTQRPFFTPKTRGERLCQGIPWLDYRSGLSTLPALANPPTANVAYQRAVFDRIGLFEPGLRSGGDLDFAWRMQLETEWQVALAPEAKIAHQHRSTLRGLLGLYAKNGWGYAMLAQRYTTSPSAISTQLVGEALVLSALLGPRQLGRFVAALARPANGALEWAGPLLTTAGSLAYQYGKIRGALDGPTSSVSRKAKYSYGTP